jgi:hypothetical protein
MLTDTHKNLFDGGSDFERANWDKIAFQQSFHAS